MKLSITEYFILVCNKCYRELETKIAGISDGKTGYRKIEISPCKNCIDEKVKKVIENALKNT